MTLEEILARLDGVTGHDGQYMARCPAHEDKQASLSVSSGKDGRVLIKCQAGCSHKAVMAALGLSERDLFPAKPSGTPKREKPHIVATYAYKDAQGALLAEKLRYSDKHFSWRRPTSGGSWEYKKPPDIVPYNLVALLKNECVYLVEGEKDVDTITAQGLPAVCSPDGAGPGKWRDAFTEWFKGKRVCIIPDNDAVGRAFAQEEASKISKAAQAVKMLDLRTIWPQLPEHGDTTDLAQHMGAREALPALWARTWQRSSNRKEIDSMKPSRINNKQGRKVNQLIKATCCNYQHRNCLLRDNDEARPCPQLLSRSLFCKWFLDAVLPSDKVLHEEIMKVGILKKCCVCGQPFRAVSNRAKYCERCQTLERRKHEAERLRKRRKSEARNSPVRI